MYRPSTCWAGPSRSQKKESLGKETPGTKTFMVKHFGMNDSTKVLNKNGHRDVQDQGGSPEEDVELTVSEAKTYRMLAARLNYMAQDNFLLQYPTKEVCRSMARPDEWDHLLHFFNIMIFSMSSCCHFLSNREPRPRELKKVLRKWVGSGETMTNDFSVNEPPECEERSPARF